MEGSKETVVSKYGKLTIGEVVAVGEVDGIQKGDIVRIAPVVPEDYMDEFLSDMYDMPIAVIPDNIVMSLIRKTI